jgi:type VI protein secretion system component Hcp
MKIPLVEISRMHRLSFQTLLLLLALACTMLLPAQSSAQTLTAGTGSGLAGTAVDLPIRLNPGSASICSLQFDFGYSAALTYVSTTPGTLPAGANVSSTSSRVIIYQFTPTPQPIANGTIVTIRFNIVAGTAPGSIPVTVSGVVASDAVANPISVSGVNGSVTVLAPADTAPPVISSVASSGITQTTATISWTTNEAADTQVQYGTTISYGSTTTLNATMTTSHSQGLTGLTAGTTYHFRVLSRDAAGNLATSGDFSFATSAPSDTTPPVISSVASSGITQTTAAISWTTNEAADTQVQYGTTVSYGSTTTLNPTMTTSHSQGLTGLTPGTTYHFRVLSRDAAGNLATSGDFSFTTTAAADTTPPVISNIGSSGITETVATISWTTNEAADTQVQYGTTISYGSTTSLNPTLTTSHSQGLTGLTPGTTYHFRVLSRDAAGNLATSSDHTFVTTYADATAPVISSPSVSSVTQTTATISWTTDEPADTQLEYGTMTSYGTFTPLDQTLVTSHSQTLTGLTAGTLYHFRIRARDASMNLAISGDFNFVTANDSDTTPPDISGVTASAITASSATILWTTSEAADSQVEYGPTTAYGSATAILSNAATSHARQLTGLAAGTLYHYRVKSRDAAGNLTTSVDYSFTTTDGTDTTPPVISAVSALGITSGGATIVWATNEAADSQVEYGNTTGYGSATALNAQGVTSHSQALTGLSGETVYHYRVKSRDAAGNLTVSDDYTFTTLADSDGTPPVITGVTAGSITTSSAVIRWTTNKAATSQVEYGTATSYGNSTTLDLIQLTIHSQTLTGLQAKTLYHFRVKSRDNAGNLTVSGDYTFTTAETPRNLTPLATMYYPRLLTRASGGAGATDPEFIGFGITNLDSQTATLRFTAYNTAGTVVSGTDIVNPVYYDLPAGQQLPMIDYQLFGAGLAGSDSIGYVKIESSVVKVAGFFMMFNGAVTELDGANVNTTPLTAFVFPEIKDDGFTKVNIASPNPDAATLTFTLVNADGRVQRTALRDIPANGTLVADLFADVFTDITPGATDYVKVTSTQPVLPFELLGKPTQYIEALNGQDAAGGSFTLYSPQYAIGAVWRTSLSIVNLSATAGNVTFRFIRDDATQIGATKVLPITANGKIYIDDPTFFQSFVVAPGDDTIEGYLEILSDGVKLTGDVVFGDPEQSKFSSALPLMSNLQTSMIFSHIASDDMYYTGVAILNPNPFDARVRIDVYDEGGNLTQTDTITLPRLQRISTVLTKLFPALQGQSRTSGYFKLTSDLPIASFALFGTHDLSALAAIPPQIVR